MLTTRAGPMGGTTGLCGDGGGNGTHMSMSRRWSGMSAYRATYS